MNGKSFEHASIIAGVIALGVAALACKGKTEEAARSGALASASASSVAVTSAPSASSTALTRYPDEQAVDPVTVTLKKPTTARLSADTSSREIASIKSGDKVVPIVLRGDYALVAIGATVDATPQGWIPGEVVIDALKVANAAPDKATKPAASQAAHGRPAHATPGPTVDEIERKTNATGDPLEDCPKGWVGMPGGYCNRPCTKDSECHGKDKCKKLGADRFCSDHDWE